VALLLFLLLKREEFASKISNDPGQWKSCIAGGSELSPSKLSLQMH
jgi:hypothetical protein